MSKIKHLSIVLTFGGLWGILEATIGTLLHLAFFDPAGIFLGTSVVMITIAYFILGIAYKKTNKAQTMFYIGLVAAFIKMMTVVFPPILAMGFDRILHPSMSILMEASLLAGVTYFVKPTSILSFKGLVSVVIANFAWRIGYVGYTAIIEASGGWASAYTTNVTKLVEFLITNFMLSTLYISGVGAIAYGIKKVLEMKNVSIKISLDKVIYNPIFSSCLVLVAFALTATLAII